MSVRNCFFPIIYVRGYAMTEKEIDATAADPFCGFNLGSTVYRATADPERSPRKFIFESPVVRLASDFGYGDVYEDGYDILDPEWQADSGNRLARRCIIIYRYYDEASSLLGNGELPPITEFAQGLSNLIARVRDLVCAAAENQMTPASFRCYLVAHSMGGLVCRAFLQNPQLDPASMRTSVDKLFTYATPHNGIEIAGRNVPTWMNHNDIHNFNREYMAQYLALEDPYARTGRVDWLPQDRFPSERTFTMVGTDRLDYEAAFGLSRTFVGHGSDGLVRVENATLDGWDKVNGPGRPCAKAYAYRAHSGYFGIVNSEEAYQNLTRFLFGDVRVDILIEVEDIRLPLALEKQAQDGRDIDALYQFELLAAPRGKLWFLSRRLAEEDSPACLRHKDWIQDPEANRDIYLSTVFLANSARVNPRRRSLAYAMTLGVRVPDYEVERMLWIYDHYEGGYLFRDRLIVEIVPPPRSEGEHWRVKYAWQGSGVTPPENQFEVQVPSGDMIEVRIPFGNDTSPGIRGCVRLLAEIWNQEE
jgi:hypothetical protein